MIAIKTLGADGKSRCQHRAWPMPTQEADGTWTPGEWVISAHATRTAPTIASVNRCKPAVYACLPDQIAEWADARAYWIELDGAVEGESKVGAVRGRLLRPVEGWTDEALRTWAYWCADRAVRIHAVAALRSAGLSANADRLAALPEILDQQTADAARAAAWDVARVAAGVAAWDVAGAARDARVAVWDAAWDAAGVAAWAAAGVARAAEGLIQSHRLCELTGIAG